MRARLIITRGQTTYEFEATEGAGDGRSALQQLAEAERWVYDSPNRLAQLDESANLAAAQPGDTVRIRTR